MRERFTPREANCSSSSRSAPERFSGVPSRFSGRGIVSVVLSAPVGSGISAVLLISTNRVTAFLLSPMSSASTCRSGWVAKSAGEQIAASYAQEGSSRPTAAAAVEEPGRYSAVGMVASAHCRTWAQACEWVETVLISSKASGRAATSTNLIGTRTSRIMRIPSEAAIASRVALTPPSTEFSMGTMAAFTSPLRRRSSALGTLVAGMRSAPTAPGTESRADSVKVPEGPR